MMRRLTPSTRTAVRAALSPASWAVRAAASAGARRLLPRPAFDRIPAGRMLDLPGRGRTFVIDVPGPTPTAPTVVLLHALGCTAYLSWAMSIGELSRSYRVITMDQRWHGRGIRSPRFRFADCADDVAALLDELGVERAVVAGYSMGGAVAQLMWRRHPERVAGLVLCSTARNYRGASRERLFFPVLTAAMHPLSRHALTRVERVAAELPETPSMEITDHASWGRSEFRSTSAWSMPEVLGELGRFNSADWVGEIDVPTAVVVTTSDHTIPERRQRRLAAAIAGATVHEAPGGHASIVLGAATWVPVFQGAVTDVVERCVAESRLAV
jgi:pimeloyl-ACP methyl ester carboxylesterase